MARKQKIDEDEPYRYECINCRSTNVFDKRERIVPSIEERYNDKTRMKEMYYCGECKSHLKQVYDKKLDKVVE